jgi:hypothetical protein
VNLTESQEADVFVAWLRVNGIRFYHAPSETGHTPEALRRAVRMKRAGTVKGYPDYCIVLPGVGLVFVELKRLKGSRTSPEQLDWIDALNACPGTQAAVCKGAQAAIDFVQSFRAIAPSDTLQF